MNQPINAEELVIKDFDPSRKIAEPWLMGDQLCMLHAWRGVGKSYFALTLAQAIASGSPFLKWPTTQGKVLYLDAEMGMQVIKERLIKIDYSAPYSAEDGALRFLTFEHMGGYPWNLSIKQNQEALEVLSEDINLLIIDNLSAFSRSLPKEDIKQTWYRLRDWLVKYANKNRSVFILHHTGKNGTQRGLSDYEDPLDTAIHIKPPENHRAEDGTKFEFYFQKSQNLYGQDLQSLMLELIPCDDGVLKWLWTPLEAYQNGVVEKKVKSAVEFNIWGKTNDDTF